MRPTVQPADSSATAEAAAGAKAFVPDEVLSDGELLLLAVKPSGWFAIFVSWPVVLAAAIVAIAWYAIKSASSADIGGPGVPVLCLAVALVRLVVGSFQWLGRTYLLTDKRLMRLRGVLKVDVFHCPLRQVTRTSLTNTRADRLLAIGTIHFQVAGQDDPRADWENLAHPNEVHRAIEEAISHARR